MFKVGDTSGLAGSANPVANEEATTLQEQNNEKSVVRKMMEYALDSFGVQSGDGGAAINANVNGQASAGIRKQEIATKVGTSCRQGVNTAITAAQKIPGCLANLTTKSSPVGGAGTVEDLSLRQQSGEFTPEELAAESCGGTPSSWLDVLKDGVSTVAEFSGNVIQGIRDDFCNTQPFPECRNCPHRRAVGMGGIVLQIPDFLSAINTAIDALLGGAIGAALDQILCPGVLGALQRGDLCALNNAVINSGVRTLVASTISAGSPSMYNTLLSVMPPDIRMVMGDNNALSKLMCSCTIGGGSVGGYGCRATSPIPRASIIGSDRSPLQQVVDSFTGRTTVSHRHNGLYGGTPSLTVKPGSTAYTSYNPLVSIVTGKGFAVGSGVTRDVNPMSSALDSNPIAAYKNSIYTGSVGGPSGGKNVAWFDEMINTLIMTGTSGDTLFSDNCSGSRMYNSKCASPGQCVPGCGGFVYTGTAPRAAMPYSGRQYNLTVGEKVAIATASVANIIANKKTEQHCHSTNLSHKKRGYLATASRCPSVITPSTPALNIIATRTATNSPAYRLTQLPGTTISTTVLNTAFALDRAKTGRPGPVDTRGCGVVPTNVDLLIYK